MTVGGLTRAEAAAVAAIDVPGLVEAVQALVRIESWGGRESPAQDFVALLMEESGLTVDRWDIDLPSVQAHPHCSWEIERTHAMGVVGTLPARGGPSGRGRSLLLNGHVDVVPPGDTSRWTHPPFAGVVEDGKIHGRGALDMKGPLMAGLFALRALARADVQLSGPVHLMSVIGEEDGGLGTLASVLRGYRADGAIVMEPTELTVASVQAGCINFRVTVPGRAAHGALRTEGVSAFEKLFDVYRAIGELEHRRNADLADDPLFRGYDLPFPISIGTIRGGDWASSVPDHVTVEGRLGVRPDERLDDARSELEAAVAEAAQRDPFLTKYPPVVSWWGGRFLPARVAADHPLVTDLLGAASATTGATPGLRAVPFGADAGLLSQVGDTPTVLFGAGDIRHAHRPDEHVSVDDLERMARTLVVMAMRFCGTERETA